MLRNAQLHSLTDQTTATKRQTYNNCPLSCTELNRAKKKEGKHTSKADVENMHNGTGLGTVRGSGTNGYVQRNIAVLRNQSTRVDYKSEEEIKKLDAQMVSKPNVEILEHARKRKVELKCMEMRELMEEQGYSKEEVEKKVSAFRQMLMQKEGMCKDKEEQGRPIASDTHAIADAVQQKNGKLRAAFGLRK